MSQTALFLQVIFVPRMIMTRMCSTTLCPSSDSAQGQALSCTAVISDPSGRRIVNPLDNANRSRQSYRHFLFKGMYQIYLNDLSWDRTMLRPVTPVRGVHAKPMVAAHHSKPNNLSEGNTSLGLSSDDPMSKLSWSGRKRDNIFNQGDLMLHTAGAL
jgi:hypothetical protein